MKKILTIVFICLTFIAKADFWTSKANLSPRFHQVSFAIGNKGYFGTGSHDMDHTMCYNDFWEYDPITNIWTQKANVPGPLRCSAIGFSINNKGYVGCGQGATWLNVGYYLNDFWEYDPTTNIWIQKADFGGSARISSSAFSIGNNGYISCGFDSITGYLKDLWQWNQLTNLWTQKDSLPGPARENAVGFSINNKGYIGTGMSASSDLNDFWEYDTLLNSWTQKASMPPGGRFNAFAFVLCDKGYVGTGYCPNPNDFWQFDPILNQWIQKANVPVSSACNFQTDDLASFAIVINNKGYAGGGNNGSATAEPYFFEYTPDSCLTTSQMELNSINLKIEIAPNPLNDKTVFTLQGTAKNASLKFYNTNGEEVFQVNDIIGINKKITISRAKLIAGIYFYQLYDADKLISSGKMIVQ